MSELLSLHKLSASKPTIIIFSNMFDAFISPLVDRLTAFVSDLIGNEINLEWAVKKKVGNLNNELKTIRLVLDDAERRCYKDQNIKDWLKRLEDASYDMDDVLDEWEMATKHKLPSPPTRSFHRRIDKKIEEVMAKLNAISKEKERYNFIQSEPTDPHGGSCRAPSTSFVEVGEIQGGESELDDLRRKVLEAGSREQGLGVQVISIVGLGGIGKTTLAQLIYNNKQVTNCYPYRIWICVSDPFDQVGIAKGIIEKVQGSPPPEACQLNMLLERLQTCISGKKFLLILDDVWTEDYTEWDPLKNCLKFGNSDSKILVTTRKKRVATMMGTMTHNIHCVGRLSDNDCWLLLSQIALFGRSPSECIKFEALGKRIAKGCKGLPLAAKALGSLLRFKYTKAEWENVVDSEIWELQQEKIDIFPDIFPHLLLSYNELSPTLKRCFSYCAIFRKDLYINVEELIHHWLALGYLGTEGELELRGREYFNNLAMLFLFQDFLMSRKNDSVINYCKMHDIIHDFATFLRMDMNENRREANCGACNTSVLSKVKKYRSCLSHHDEPAPNISCECMVSLRILRIELPGLKSFTMEVEKLIHLRWLHLCGFKLTGENMKIICKLCSLRVLRLNSCDIQEIPREIGNLVKLRTLDLSLTKNLKELPESVYDLQELRSLCLNSCHELVALLCGIHKLEKLKRLNLFAIYSLKYFPDEDVGRMIHLRTLDLFQGKLSYLKKLNKLSGYLKLRITNKHGEKDVIEEAKEADLSKKLQIQDLCFEYVDESIDDPHLSMAVLDALKPHPNLYRLRIDRYNGFKLPDWIISPINQVREISLYNFKNLLQLPSLGKLPCLEHLLLLHMEDMELVGWELLGITKSRKDDNGDVGPSSSTPCTTVAFPMLREHYFYTLCRWKEWEDITLEEQNSTMVSCFPNLEYIKIYNCKSLKALPHGLLRKATKLEKLIIEGSKVVEEHYDKRKEGSAWKFISHIPHVELESVGLRVENDIIVEEYEGSGEE